VSAFVFPGSLVDTYSWIALRAVEGVGPVLFRRLLERFETPAGRFPPLPMS